MDLMSFEQVNAFIEAFQDLYGIDLSADVDGPFLNGTVHHGKSPEACCVSDWNDN
jgi:hypothetical protein